MRSSDYAKAHGLILSGKDRNNGYHLLEDLKQIDRSIMTAYKIARAKKIGMFRLKRFGQIRKLYVAALLEELTNTIDVAEIGTGVQLRAVVAAGWDEVIIPEDLSFWSEDELRRVFDGFQFPALMRSKSGNEYTGEEIF